MGTVCARCGAGMECHPEGGCWCAKLPAARPMPKAGEKCLCPKCLADDIERAARAAAAP
jgi:hypothetical protein